MPVGTTAPGTYLDRAIGNNFLDGNDDFTIMFWFKQNEYLPHSVSSGIIAYQIEDATVAQFITVWIDQFDVNYQELYIDGTGLAHFDSYADRTVITPGVWVLMGMVYDNTAKTLDLYINNTFIDTYTADFSTAVFTNERLNYPVATANSVSFRKFRSWQRKLTSVQLINESASDTAIVTTDLFMDTPLTNAGDLDDTSGNNNDWFPIGGLTTDNEDIAVVAGVANIDATTAEEITSLPYSVAQNIITAGTHLNPVWYKWTAPAAGVIGWITAGCSDDAFTVFYESRPGVYLGPASAPTVYQGLDASNVNEDQPTMFTVEAGVTYYFLIECQSFASDAGILIFQMRQFENLDSNLNAFFIPSALNSAIDPNVAVILDPSETPLLRKCLTGMTRGEGGDVWASKRFILDNAETDLWDIYNADLSLKEADVNFPSVGRATYNFPSAKINRATDTMYISSPGTGATHAFARTVTEAGVLGTLINLGVAQVNCIAPAPGDDYLYFGGEGTRTAGIIGVNRIKISDSTITTNFISGISGYILSDILTLVNGTIVCLWLARNNTYRCIVRTYNSSGVQQTTRTFAPSGQTTARITHDTTETHIWLWDEIEGPPGSFGLDPTGSGRNGRFQKLLVSDLSTIDEFQHPTFDNGRAGTGSCIAPPDLWGGSSSCPFFRIAEQAASNPPNPLSGIYQIVPDKRNDTLWVSFDPEVTEDVKIPDPFFKTGLIGK